MVNGNDYLADWQLDKARSMIYAARLTLGLDADYAVLRRRLGYCIIAWALISLLSLRLTVTYGADVNFVFSFFWFVIVSFLYVFQDAIAHRMIKEKDRWIVKRFFLPRAG